MKKDYMMERPMVKVDVPREQSAALLKAAREPERGTDLLIKGDIAAKQEKAK